MHLERETLLPGGVLRRKEAEIRVYHDCFARNGGRELWAAFQEWE